MTQTIETKRRNLWNKTHPDFRGLSDKNWSPHWPDKSRTIMLPVNFDGRGYGSSLARLDDLTEAELDRLLK